ncbi:protein phosphatase [Arachnia propionica]|uniref:Protein phosphatase n=1 Tax=Arachnia propionica TaxID=1750 RepID=A0A3P1T450_9ACTN|nr:protein phosphatase 2C domain-containing protein [Arachnia propionica]RRD03586.1 protein phosphatase [Arachnia propionica]
MTFSLDFRVHSEVGRVRQNNQDAAYASPHLLLVADGMGGAAAGDLASAVAATEAGSSDRRLGDDHLLEHMAGIMQRANDRLADLIHWNLDLDGMGTTFCGAAFSGTMLGIAHIGDSRGYLLRDGELQQLTHDHSWVQSLIDEGRLTPEQAASHPHRSLILKVLNGSDETEPDFFELEVQAGDVVLFCSDGLSGLVSDEELRTLAGGEDLDEAVARLAALANANGGYDNISLVLARVVPQRDDLDARPGVLAGSALEREIPKVVPDDGPGYPEPPEAVNLDHGSDETARYAPRDTKRRWAPVLAALVAVLLLLGGAFWAVRLYSASRYFVAAANGHVAIFNGLPGTLLGRPLHRLVEERDTLVEDLPVHYQQQVAGTISAPDLQAATETADILAEHARRCSAERTRRDRAPAPTPGGQPTVAPLPTVPDASVPAQPSPAGPPTLLTAPSSGAAESDPEGC